MARTLTFNQTHTMTHSLQTALDAAPTMPEGIALGLLALALLAGVFGWMTMRAPGEG